MEIKCRCKVSINIIICNRLKKKKDTIVKEVEKSCVFKPEIISKTGEHGSEANFSDIKGVSKFIERQKNANEARKEKELYQQRDIGANWVRKTTVPTEFSITKSVKIVVS